MFQRFSLERCYIIAEIGGNFTTVEEGRRLIDAARECGVDAVKLQTYRAETITSVHAQFDMENTGVCRQFDVFKQYEVDEATHKELFDYAAGQGLDWFSTPSHETDVELLDRLGVGAHKIGSDDAVNFPFLKFVARRGKPVLLSTGMCTLEEVKQAVSVIHGEGNRDLILLHCVTSYPTHPEHVNLRAMQTLAEAFPGVPVGYSDHTLGITACLCAAAMGARVLEKHFTVDKSAPGPDHQLSADPAEMSELVRRVREFELMAGDGIKRPAASEATTRINNRKSVCLMKDRKAGDVLTVDDLSIKRPGTGVPPAALESLAGRRLRKDKAADDVLFWEDLG